MGSVTATVSNTVGEVFSSESLHFESYEDFLNYESIKSPVDFDSSKEENKNNIYLTDKQAYKLRIILGHVLGDKDCYEINKKLEDVFGGEIFVEDYEKMYFSIIVDGERLPLDDAETETAIQFKEEE